MAEIIAIVSGKGGAGKSTVSVLLGKSLASLGKKVLLVDADIGLNSLDILTGSAQKIVYNWGDAAAGRCTVNDCIIKCAGGLNLMSAPKYDDAAFTAEQFSDTVKKCEADFDFILIDGPAGIGSGMALAAAPAKKALVISAPDDVSVNGSRKAGERVLEAGPKQVRLIINRFSFKAVKKCRQINIDNVIDRSGIRLIGIIPEDKNLWYFGSGGMLLKNMSLATESCLRISKRLLGKNVSLDLSLLK